MHPGIALQEREDERLHHFARRRGKRVDAQRARRNLLERLCRQHGVVNIGHRRTDPFDEGLARVSERDTSRRPVEETDAETLLQLRDGIA